MPSIRPIVTFVASTLVAVAAFSAPASAAPLEVACTGTSAMQGLGSTTGHHVPDEMGRVLGAGFDVRNFGVQGTTAIKSISSSYAATSQMKAALALNPDIVLFWFGGNDSFAGTWDAHKTEFKADYTSLVRAFQALPTHPKTFLVRLWVFVDTPVQRTVLDKEILPIIDQIASETGSTLIDYRKLVESHSNWFPDGMHPNDTGTLAIGKLFADTVTATLAADDDAGTRSDAAVDAAGGMTVADANGGGLGGSGGGGPDDAASGIDARADLATSGTGGSGGTTGGASVGGSGGAATGGVSTTATGAGNVTPTVPSGADEGGCSISRSSASGSGSAWLLVLLGVVWARRRGRSTVG